MIYKKQIIDSIDTAMDRVELIQDSLSKNKLTKEQLETSLTNIAQVLEQANSLIKRESDGNN